VYELLKQNYIFPKVRIALLLTALFLITQSGTFKISPYPHVGDLQVSPHISRHC